MRSLHPVQLFLAALLFTTLAQPHVEPLSEQSSQGPTSVTDSLNKQIESGYDMNPPRKGVYLGGKGVIVRTPDFFAGGNEKVVPGSLWVNDLWTPNSAYPSFNPWCPHGSSDGYFDISWSKCEVSDEGPWRYATVAAVVGDQGKQGMSELFANFNDIQGATWGYGVFYAADANAADKRCRNFGEHHGFDCPGYWIDYDGTKTADSSRKGSGFWPPGNPYAGGGGGGTGCHFDKATALIDQTDAWTTQNPSQNLVQDLDCQCNYIFNDDWSHWVDNWVNHAKQKAGFEKRAWLGGRPGKAPQWGLDVAMCWVNNPRDMINLQNQLWVKHNQWLNGAAPHWSSALPHPSEYWGWNEVPVSRSVIDNPKKWDTILIKLPVGLNGVNGLEPVAALQLEKNLQTWKSKGSLKPGFANAGRRPGSYVVFATELQWKTGCPGDVEGHNAPCFRRNFFCENWQSPQNWFQVKYVPKSASNKNGCCYVSQNNMDPPEVQTLV